MFAGTSVVWHSRSLTVQGLHAARLFVEQNVMTRHVDLTGIFKFRNPKYMLSHAVTKHLVDAGVPITPESGRIESR